MPWPDVLIAVSTGALGVFALAMLRDTATYVPRLSSAAYALAIAGIAAGLYASGLMLGAAVNMADAAVWAAIFAVRGAQTKGE